MAKLGSLAYWSFVAASSASLFWGAVVLWLLTVAFDRRLVLLHRYTCFWASLYTWLNPLWRVEVIGREKIDPSRTYVMVSNHLSLVDIFVLFRLFRHYKWVSKIENFRLPFIGWNMTLNRYIPLRRGDRNSVAQMFEACRKTLASGSSILMFPEGTRSPDGRLLAFKRGAFVTAVTENVPVLPIAIDGTERLMEKGSLEFPRGQDKTVRIKVMDPVRPPADGGFDDRVRWMRDRTREAMVAALDDLRGAPGAAERPTI